jgi:hypothetical protein
LSGREMSTEGIGLQPTQLWVPQLERHSYWDMAQVLERQSYWDGGSIPDRMHANVVRPCTTATCMHLSFLKKNCLPIFLYVLALV